MSNQEIASNMQQNNSVSEMHTKAHDEIICIECGNAIKAKAEICAKCGVRQRSAGFVARFKRRVSHVKLVLQEEQRRNLNISSMRRLAAVVVAVSAGWTGLTGLGSFVAGRPKAGAALLGVPFMMICICFACTIGWVLSLVASIFLIGIPFLMFFTGVLMPLLPLTVATWWSFYIADIMIAIRAN